MQSSILPVKICQQIVANLNDRYVRPAVERKDKYSESLGKPGKENAVIYPNKETK